ncbi:MAG: bifunctional metallophosphatase/5'-nucleotidase [Bacteroidales bacterium]|nr:bifunctional metallophosphatase/5'-nucleotidase [Bacteroidales bacterium]
MAKEINRMIMKRLLAALLSVAAVSCGPEDGEYTFRILSTNDVHGRYFDSTYVSDRTRQSLLSVSWYVDSLRNSAGKENVILIDAGDCLQGDNAAYYFNYVDTLSEHLYARMVDYMGYDAVVVGNHDIETGHPVYDRIVNQMSTPFLAANALRTGSSEPYFREYVIVKRHGLKIAVLGFTNPNIRNWLSPKLWEGMEFRSLLPFVQETVDRVRTKERPDVVVVAVHSGTGEGDGRQYESQGLDLFKSLSGVDFVICSHDHRPVVLQNDSIALINAGSHCRNIGHGQITLKVKKGNVVSKSLSAGLINVDKNNTDEAMRTMFQDDYEAVKAFTLEEVGELKADLITRDSYRGMSDYMNLIHTISLGCAPARISFAAPLTFNGYVKAGTLVYNDLFTIYPFENQLYVVKMTGKEIKDYLEYSYDLWINTYDKETLHLLKIADAPDPRTGQANWSFVNRFYNFDSAGGLVYEVDVTRPSGERVFVRSMADGTPFALDAEYDVAMTSYRASGGGGIMRNGAGVDTDRIEERTVAYYPEIRDLLYDYLKKNGSIDPEVIGNPAVIGRWNFVPYEEAEKALDKDMKLLFPRS